MVRMCGEGNGYRYIRIGKPTESRNRKMKCGIEASDGIWYTKERYRKEKGREANAEEGGKKKP